MPRSPQISLAMSRSNLALSRIRSFTENTEPQKTLLQFNIHALKLPYCILAWGSAAKTALLSMYIIQKKAARLITYQNYTAHANPLFKKLKLLTINDIHKLEVVKYGTCSK